jgi:hypothetical protein
MPDVAGRQDYGARAAKPSGMSSPPPQEGLTMSRSLAALLTAALALPMLGASAAAHAPATADRLVAEEHADASDTVEHVANVTYDTPWPQGAVRASDSDFVTATVRPGDVPGRSAAEPDGVHWYREDLRAADYRQRVARQPERVFNVMGTYWHGMQIVDVTDRDDPVRVAAYDCRVAQADVFTFEQGTRTYAAYTQDAAAAQSPEGSHCHEANGTVDTNERGTYLVELTDPFRPADRGFLRMAKGTHQVTVHPSGDFVYNSAAVVVTTQLGFIEVYDVSDIAGRDPDDWGYEIVDEIALLTGLDSHDLTFSADGDRAYSAAINHSFVIDSSDPTDNEILGRVYDPSINIHHDAHAVEAGDHTFLLIGDELAGAAGNAYCPGGGIHVFDITGDLERAPVKVGAFFIPEVGPTGVFPETCTAHVLDIHPEEELIVIAWYNAGVRVHDYSGLADAPVGGIEEVGFFHFPDSVLWSAKVPEIREDASYLDRHSLSVMERATEEPVDPTDFAWDSLAAGEFSERYWLRQAPGGRRGTPVAGALGPIRDSRAVPHAGRY